MNSSPLHSQSSSRFSMSDLTAGLVVYLVALPLCLGVAKASGAEYVAGILAGIIGGIVVGLISGSHTSVSGPAAGLTAVVAAQIQSLKSFEAFLLALVIGGLLQIVMGVAGLGFLSAFVPTSVIKGLLAAIGIILILKQIPHVVGHDADPEGEMSFLQIDDQNTLSELYAILNDFHLDAAIIGLMAVGVLVLWDRVKFLKHSPIPGPLVAVALGVAMSEFFRRMGGSWVVGGDHLVTVPVADSFDDVLGFLRHPDFSKIGNYAVWTGAVTIALVASLETLVNLEAVDRLDPHKRESPSSRELVAQGIGNTVVGLIGGIPLTSVIVRSSVNVTMGATSKASTVIHGALIFISVVAFPTWINRIPLSCLAAILLVTGFKLSSPKIIREMWQGGRNQFLPFAATVLAIIFTDLLVGILIGLAVSIAFVLHSNLLRPLRRIVERHPAGDVLRIELGSQVSFLNIAVLERALLDIPRGGHVLIDAGGTEYIDSDVQTLIEEFKERTGPVRGVQVSLRGFDTQKHGPAMGDDIHYVDYVDRETQSHMTPQRVIALLKDGNDRFRTGRRLSRDLGRQMHETAPGQHPLAVILSCIDSRAPAELVFDLGLGDIFSVRIAGNVVSRKVLGSIEYGCTAGGAKLVLVMGHTRCGAITEAVRCLANVDGSTHGAASHHLQFIVDDIGPAVDDRVRRAMSQATPSQREQIVDDVARRHVELVIDAIRQQSSILRRLDDEGVIKIVGGMYDIKTGTVDLGITSSIPAASTVASDV